MDKKSKTEGSKAAQFQPGQSGNPAGRQPDTALKEVAKQKTNEAFQVVLNLMDKGRSERIKLKAAELVLAYGHGKPRQWLDVETPEKEMSISEKFEAIEAYHKSRTPLENEHDEQRAEEETRAAIQRCKGRLRAGLPQDHLGHRLDMGAWRVHDLEGYSEFMGKYHAEKNP